MSDRKDPEKLAAENRDDNPENNGKTRVNPAKALPTIIVLITAAKLTSRLRRAR